MEGGVRAALLILCGDLDGHALECVETAEAHGARAVTLVRRWEDWVTLAGDRLVELGIVPDEEHLPADRVPRIVSAGAPPTPPSGWRRPQVVRVPPSPDPLLPPAAGRR